MALHATCPSLKLVVQDKDPVIQQALAVWMVRHPAAISEGKVHLSAHNFFEANPVRGADVYWLRYIMLATDPLASHHGDSRQELTPLCNLDTTGPMPKRPISSLE